VSKSGLLKHGGNPNLKSKNFGGYWTTPFSYFVSKHTDVQLASRAFELTKLFLSKGAIIDEKIKEEFDNSFLVKNNQEFKKLIEDSYRKTHGGCVFM
jgi:hypothetical protein